MKKNKWLLAALAALILVTAVAAVWHLATRQTSAAGTLRIEAGGQVTELPLSKLPLTAVKGTVVNGKGEEKTIDAPGTSLADALAQADVTRCTQVTVVADDEYSATVTAEEIAQPDKVYLLMQEGERPQLLVFGDANSKRNVSDVIRLVVQ